MGQHGQEGPSQEGRRQRGRQEGQGRGVKVKVAQLWPTLCYPMDCIVHGILQARIPEWVAFPFSRGSSHPRDRTQVSHIAGGLGASLTAQLVKNLPAMQETLV